MSFSSLYRVSFYVMLTLATLTLNIDAASDFPLAPLYPIVVAAACVLAFLTVDRDPSRGLPTGLAQALALGSIGLSLAEYWWDETLLVLAMGHWLVYLMLIKILRPKSVEDDWFLYMLALTQVIVGAFLPGENVGFILVLWAIAALWTLGLFYLRREAGPPRQVVADATIHPAPNPREPYPGLIDLPFVVSGLKVGLLTVALGGLIFLLMPRRSIGVQARAQSPGLAQSLTGFSDTVQLGQMGQILESESVVMSIELYDEQDERIAPGPEPLWRGVVMQTYEDGVWRRPRTDPVNVRKALAVGPRPLRFIRQQIKLEPTSSSALFGMRPVLQASGPNLVFSRDGGTILRNDLRGARVLLGLRGRVGQYDYSVTSGRNPNAPQLGESYPETLVELLAVPDEPALRETLEQVLDRVLAGIPPDQIQERARALERHLRDSGEYAYSLDMTLYDPSIDPIADFLRNRKQGHCEYYASALTMLLRAAGIPARMVNGFKGGDWNPLGRVLVVRQKHAHSWVEALVGRTRDITGEPMPIWLTLDPTPARERDESVDQIGGIGRHFRFFSDYLRYLWVFYVVGFNEERQERVIYGPIRALIEDARNGFVVMRGWLSDLGRSLLHFPDLRSFFSVRGFVVSVLTLLLLAGLVRVARWVFLRVVLRGRRIAADDGEASAALAAYRRLARILSELGLHRPPAETPREFASRAAEVLSARGPEVAALAAVPAAVVDAFYGIRFGDRSLGPDDSRALEDRLDALEASLRPPQQP